MGGVQRSRSDEPVSRPTALNIPPSVPLMKDGGATGGSAVGCTGDEDCKRKRRGPGAPANDVTGLLAQRMRGGARPALESRRHRGPRDIKRSDWRVGRAGSITSGLGFFRQAQQALRRSGIRVRDSRPKERDDGL